MTDLHKKLRELQEITRGCPEDMSNPQDLDLRAVVKGYIFNNVIPTGDNLNIMFMRGDDEYMRITLCDLIALARMAATHGTVRIMSHDAIEIGRASCRERV